MSGKKEKSALESKIKKVIVANTKGGCGKSTLAQHIVPFYFYEMNNGLENLNLSIIEIDTTNKTRENYYLHSCVKYILNNLNNPNEIKEMFIDSFFDENDNFIFDIGGGRDSLETIESLLEVESGIDDFLFVIPFFPSEDSFSGAFELYERIIAKKSDTNILFVVNKISYSLDGGRLPYKKYLSDDDILKELERVGIDTTRLTNKNIPFTYVPEFIDTLPSHLFTSNGCCLDFCEELLTGTSANKMREEIKTLSKEFSEDVNIQKAYYKKEVLEIQRKADLYSFLGYSKPFFDKIKSFK